MKCAAILSVLAFLPLASCSTMVTSVPSSNDKTTGEADYVYRLPKTLVRIAIPETFDKVEEIAVSTRSAPDPKHEYLLRYAESVFADDALVIDRAENEWTLGKVHGVAEDKTADAIKNLAKSAGKVKGFTDFSGDAAVAVVIAEFDPFEPDAMTHARQALASNGMDATCIDCTTAHEKRTTLGTIDGVPTRTKSVHHLKVCKLKETGVVPATPCEGASASRIIAFEAFNGNAVTALKVGRSWFVRRETTITFRDGEVAKVDIKKPSEAVVAATLPGDIVSSFASGFTEGLQSKRDIMNARKDSATALIEVRQKELELEKTEIDVAKQRKCLNDPAAAVCQTPAETPTTPAPTTPAPTTPAPTTPAQPTNDPQPPPAEGAGGSN